MQAMDDMALLREYATNNSQAAFEELVARRVHFVHSAALRQVRDPHAAAEITQAVFIILAQKAGRISDKTSVAGWLFKTTRFTALAQMRDIAKRRQREQEASMQTAIESTAPDALWEQMSPLLDEALTQLGERDRAAVLSRYFDNKSLADVGRSLGTGEDTARKRVSRALEKLRKFFAKRGVVCTAAIIGGTLAANSVQAAPPALVKSVSLAVVSKGAAAGGSTLTLIKGALKIMAWTKAKTVAVTAVAVLLAAGTTTVVVEKVAHGSQTGGDPSWADDSGSWELNSQVLETLPPAMIIRPTRFAGSGGGVRMDRRILQRDCHVGQLVDAAYDTAETRTIFPEEMPTNAYDLLYTLSAEPSSVLPQEIKRQFGYIAHKETREMDVLLLQVVKPNAPNLQPTQNGRGGFMRSGSDETTILDQDISSLDRHLEGLMRQPVLDRTELKGHYDVTLKLHWDRKNPDQEALKNALLEQLGLELVPGRESIEMLVVEKAK